jgi:hypothetical protein
MTSVTSIFDYRSEVHWSDGPEEERVRWFYTACGGSRVEGFVTNDIVLVTCDRCRTVVSNREIKELARA